MGPTRFDAAIANGPPSDHMLDDLDTRFFAGPSKTLLATNAAWLRTLPASDRLPTIAMKR